MEGSGRCVLMPFELVIEPDTEIVHLTYHGTILLQERVDARDAVFEKCRDGIHYRVQVDMRDCDIKMTIDNAMEFSKVFESANLPPNYRLACLIEEQNLVERLLQTFISIGKINVKYFMEEAPAIKWLLAK